MTAHAIECSEEAGTVDFFQRNGVSVLWWIEGATAFLVRGRSDRLPAGEANACLSKQEPIAVSNDKTKGSAQKSEYWSSISRKRKRKKAERRHVIRRQVEEKTPASNCGRADKFLQAAWKKK
jgi:hypothetical protein